MTKEIKNRLVLKGNELPAKMKVAIVKMKLFRVTLRGMTYSAVGPCYGLSYVVADSMDGAYKAVRTSLDERDLGFSHDRELDRIELIADIKEYRDCGCILYLQVQKEGM